MSISKHYEDYCKVMPVECFPNIEYSMHDLEKLSKHQLTLFIHECLKIADRTHHYRKVFSSTVFTFFDPIIFKEELKKLASKDNAFDKGSTREVFRILYCVPLEDVPLFINYPIEGMYAQFRLEVGK